MVPRWKDIVPVVMSMLVISNVVLTSGGDLRLLTSARRLSGSEVLITTCNSKSNKLTGETWADMIDLDTEPSEEIRRDFEVLSSVDDITM